MPRILTHPLGDTPPVLPPVINRRETGLSLVVLPSVLPSNYISLDIRVAATNLDRDLITRSGLTAGAPRQGNSDLEEAGRILLSGDPAIIVRPVNTEVSVEDGASIVIGGLVHDVPKHREVRDVQLPILSDLPTIGRLFHRSAEPRQRNEWVIFITPEIVNPVEE